MKTTTFDPVACTRTSREPEMAARAAYFGGPDGLAGSCELLVVAGRNAGGRR